MKKTHLGYFLVMVFSSLLSSVAHASEIDYTGNLGSNNQIDNYIFNVASSDDVNLFTTSDYPINPLLTLWMQSGSDWQLVASNDYRSSANLNETGNLLDAKIEQVLNAGNYEVTVSWSGNAAAGNLLSNGYTQQGSGGATLFDTYNPYQLTIVDNGQANVAAVVPLPTAAWFFGTVLMGFLGWSKKRA
jgi:hypothetical protein